MAERRIPPPRDIEQWNAQIGGFGHILQNLARAAVTGMTGEDLRNAIQNPRQRAAFPFLERFATRPGTEEARVASLGEAGTIPGLSGDKAAHALANYLGAKRIGPRAMEALGLLQEVPTALTNLLATGDAFGPHGFSPEDLVANAIGRNAALAGFLRGGFVMPGTLELLL